MKLLLRRQLPDPGRMGQCIARRIEREYVSEMVGSSVFQTLAGTGRTMRNSCPAPGQESGCF